MKKWAVRKADGSIKIIYYKSDPSWLLDKSDTLIGEVSKDDLPDREYRNCWKEDSGQLKVDLSKAREKRLAEIREERDKRLKESDETWIEVKTKGGDTRSIESKKQTLRNIPEIAEQALSSKLSVNTIKAYDPFEGLD